MALYLPDQNALFLHLPRTGGRFVAKTLQETLGLNVREVGYEHSHKDAIGLVRFRKQPYTFAFVRHPVSWYASYWRSKVARKGKHWSIAAPDTLWHPAWPIDPILGSDDFD